MIGTMVFMRTNIHWARKSQQPLVVIWAIEMRNTNDSTSISSKFFGTTDCKKKDVFTDRIVTYSFNYVT